MDQFPRATTASNVLAGTLACANMEAFAEEEGGADADEPPEPKMSLLPASNHFKRGPIQRGSEHPESLLTRALHSHSEDDMCDKSSHRYLGRKRSITSTCSIASTAELTCDTGITTPARTSSPSPRLRDVGLVPLVPRTTKLTGNVVVPVEQATEKKRCISFACAAQPKVDARRLMPPPLRPANEQVLTAAKPWKQEWIRCAGPRQATTTAPVDGATGTRSIPNPTQNTESGKELASASWHHRSSSSIRDLRSQTPRQIAQSPSTVRIKKCLTVTATDLESEGSRFHEFASDEHQDDDWVRCQDTVPARKITIYDTLAKENAIRMIGKEAEEEEEEEIDQEEDDKVHEDNDEEEDDEIEDEEAEQGEDGEDDEDLDELSSFGSDGYNTDNEVGFADSDDSDDDLVLWITRGVNQLSIPVSGAVPFRHRSSNEDGGSDSSSIHSHLDIPRPETRHRIKRPIYRPGTPELPDSTDFVCGTLDEDKATEEAYISCLAIRKREKHRPIPQDIDPSFPTSDPEDDEDDDLQRHSSDDQLWLHGELEDLHDERERPGRWNKSHSQSPKRRCSPLPSRRLHSPPPKSRGRSPKRLFERPSPRRLKSPPSGKPAPSLNVSPDLWGAHVIFKSGTARLGLSQASLPRTPVVLPITKRRGRAGTVSKDRHVRGAIDIVRGLEQKQQRRKETYYKKYCNRARKEKAQEKRPPKGTGADRMKEIGLMAGKQGQGKYVISV